MGKGKNVKVSTNILNWEALPEEIIVLLVEWRTQVKFLWFDSSVYPKAKCSLLPFKYLILC